MAVVTLLALAGCHRALAPVNAPAPVPLNAPVQVSVRALPSANPSASGLPQPVKACVVRIRNSTWRPPLSNQALPCSGFSEGGDVLSVSIAYLAPGQVHAQEVRIEDGSEQTLMVAAEFQLHSPEGDPLFMALGPHHRDIAIELADRSVRQVEPANKEVP
jgi:predicted component of type VI protein secretion system